MFYRAASHLSLAEHGTPLRVDYVLCHGIHDGASVHVRPLYLVTMVRWCRQEGYGKVEPRMQPLAAEGETLPDSILS